MCSEGEYYDRNLGLENGHQYGCLEMTLESGLGLLEELREMRRLELRTMEVAQGATEGFAKERKGGGYLKKRKMKSGR